ncbi:MAG TPA: lytic transglycosylase domain-containing protein, partial [Bryobacteraceae bacterium]|nr:lytic transglycosylase domain-containing protein [Bryobacteraceae bacterium]
AIRYIKSLAGGYLSIPFDAAPEKFWRLAFPLPYRSAVEMNSRLRSLDPYMVAALIRQESEFNPQALSRVKAYGLTQVMPSTGRELSRKLGVRKFTAKMLFQPDINLKLGTYYLRSLLDQLGGEWETTLASYNAGKSRVLTWLNWARYEEPAEFIETIPFTETRNYVQIVLRNADVYRRLYGPKQAAVTSTNGLNSRRIRAIGN